MVCFHCTVTIKPCAVSLDRIPSVLPVPYLLPMLDPHHLHTTSALELSSRHYARTSRSSSHWVRGPHTGRRRHRRTSGRLQCCPVVPLVTLQQPLGPHTGPAPPPKDIWSPAMLPSLCRLPPFNLFLVLTGVASEDQGVVVVFVFVCVCVCVWKGCVCICVVCLCV